MKTKLLITAVFIFSFFISCDRNADKQNMKALNVELTPVSEPDLLKTKDGLLEDKQQIPVGTFIPQSGDSSVAPPQINGSSNPDWDSKIIKTASVKLEIKDFKKYNDYVHNAVKQYGAYVAQEEQNFSDDKSETVITIKVPVAQFETMMNRLPGDDGKVLEKKINTDDVTGEVVDTRSRLEAKKQMRLKYLEFLKQSKNMEEVLQVQSEINNIQVEIESAASRVSFLSHQSAFSTINLCFYQPMEGYKPTDSTPSFITRISAAFKTGTSWLTDLLVALMSLWPLWLLAGSLYIGWKKIRRPKLVTQKIKIAEQNINRQEA